MEYLLLYIIINKNKYFFMANKIIHKHSSVITEDGKPKLPNQDQIEYGEIAINYAVGEETISLKNSSNQIIEFKSDQYYKKIIDENEFVTANALTDLNYRLNETNELLDTKSPTGHTHVSSAITDSISVSSGITNSASGLVQGKAVYDYAAPKSHNHSAYSPTGHTHGTITLSGDVTGSGTIGSGTTAINITTTVADDSHNHSNYAPKSHASSATTYGAATTSNYGHVKISNGDVATVASADGLAAGMDHTHSNYSTTGHTHSAYSPTGHTHVSSVITDSINSMSGITGTETKLVQAKAVYELINDTFDSIVTNIEENELVTATAITELESLLNEIGEEFIIGEQNRTTSVFLGTTQSDALFDGKKIIYWLPCDTMEGEPVSLMLKLSNNRLVRYPIYINGLTPLTNEYGAGTPIRLIFRENVNVNNTTVSGWWCELEIKKTPYEVITLSNSTVDIPAERGVSLQDNISIPANSIVNFNLTFDVTKSITSNIMIFISILSQNSGVVSSAAGSIPVFTATSTMLPTTTISFSHYFSNSDIISIGASASGACRFVNALSGVNGVISENASSIIIIPQ